MTTPKPREWWLHNTDSAGDVYKWGFCSGTFDPAIKSVHVIEYSAFSKTCEQLLGSHAELVELRSAYKSAIEERDALKAQLAKVTREMDEARAEIYDMKDVYYDIVKMCNASGTEDVRVDLQCFLDEYEAERAKAERYRRALNKIASAGMYDGTAELQACAAEALTEAEGE